MTNIMVHQITNMNITTVNTIAISLESLLEFTCNLISTNLLSKSLLCPWRLSFNLCSSGFFYFLTTILLYFIAMYLLGVRFMLWVTKLLPFLNIVNKYESKLHGDLRVSMKLHCNTCRGFFG